MVKDERGQVASEGKPASLWPTAIGLTVLFLGTFVFVNGVDDLDYFFGVAALLSMLVTFVGILALGLGGLWAAFKGRGPVARSRLLRAAMYLCFGVASFAAARQHGRDVDDFRTRLQPGTSVQEALRRLDALYTEHPRRWRFISGWGTTQELALADYRKIGQSDDSAVPFTWSRGEPRLPAAVAATAVALSKTKQVWFTFRTDIGFLHFFVTLDERGLIKSVSKSTGHQA